MVCFYLQDLNAAEEKRDQKARKQEKKKAREVEHLKKEKQLNKLKVKVRS